MGANPFMSQDMALIKPPFVGSEKPWHQDQAYFNIPLGQTVVGVWIALDEAVPENGCMYIIPGSHTEGPVIHFKRRDWQICDTEVASDHAIAVPLKPGGACCSTVCSIMARRRAVRRDDGERSNFTTGRRKRVVLATTNVWQSLAAKARMYPARWTPDNRPWK